MSVKGLLSGIYKELHQLNLKTSKEFDQTLLQRRYTSGQHENMPNILSHQGNANQNYFIPIRMAITHFKRKINLDEDIEDLKPSYIAGKTVKESSLCGKQFLKKNHKTKTKNNPKTLFTIASAGNNLRVHQQVTG